MRKFLIPIIFAISLSIGLFVGIKVFTKTTFACCKTRWDFRYYEYGKCEPKACGTYEGTKEKYANYLCVTSSVIDNDCIAGTWKKTKVDTVNCNIDEEDYYACPIPTLTPTPTKEPEPSLSPSPSPIPTTQPIEQPEVRGLSEASAPVCNAPAVIKAPIYNADSCKRIDADTINCNWIVNDGNTQRTGIYYGTTQSNLSWFYEIAGHENNNLEVNAVPTGNFWFKLCSIGTCGDQVCGATYDP